jgi:outer membrane protein insertion porin family
MVLSVMGIGTGMGQAAGVFDIYNEDFGAVETPSANQVLGDIYSFDENFDNPVIKPASVTNNKPTINAVEDTYTTPSSTYNSTTYSRGFEAPEVVPAIQYSSADNENRTIKDIEIHGTNSVDPELVMQKINLQRGDDYSRELLQNDLKSIYQLGFFTEKMRAIPVPNEDGTVTIKIMLQENAPITDFTVEGNTVVSTEDIMNVLMPMKGKPQNIGELNEAIAKIQDMYTSQGYVLSRVDSVNDDPDGTINISIKEGKIDKIMIQGNEKTKDYVVERNILTEPGTVYNENVLKEDLIRLYATQAFKDVTREIEPSEDIPDAYDITIKVQEQRTASISLGGGLDTVTGVFGSLGISDNNFRGVNQRLSLSGLAGTGVILNDASIERRMNLQAELSFYEPYFLNRDTSLMSKIFFRDFGSYQVPLAIERRIGGEVTMAHRLKKNKNVTSTLSLGVENVDVREGNFAKISSMYSRFHIPISERAKQLEGGMFLSLSPSIIYDTRDSATVTRKGTMANLRYDEQFGLDGFEKTHGRITGMVKQYIPIGKKSSFSLTAKGGGKIHGDHMPEVMAYRLGGPYTVRGYKMSGIGTGDGFIMGSAELAVPIPFLDRTRINFLHNLRFTVWADAGKVFGDTVSNKLYDRPMYGVSAGIGLKIYVPGMGPLSIDYGIPLTNTGAYGPKNGYFTFGVGDIMY